MSKATGIGSWPGDDARTTLRVIRDTFADADEPGIPYLPELPSRGPGADLVGRAAGMLADLAVDLQPSGWRLVDRPGRDAQRTAAVLRRDLDDLAEVFDGYTGDLKVQVAGPWTLAAELRVARGERVIVDPGAVTDVRQSLAEGIRSHLVEVANRVPGARLVLQIDEPLLPAVLAGELTTSSGFGRLTAVDPQNVRGGLAEIVEAARDGAEVVAVHCCAPRAPLPLLREAGVDAMAVDCALLSDAGWESIAASVESGVRLWAGVLSSDGEADLPRTAKAVIEPLVRRWDRLGLDTASLDQVVLTPACGLPGSTPARAVAIHRLVSDAAKELTWQARQS